MFVDYKYKKPIIVVEIGCNHKGDLEIAKEMIRVAKECGADVAKFQKRCNKELLTEEQYNAPHPNPINAYGKTYGEHREFLEFSVEQHKILKECCENYGIEYSTSVWDLTSAKEITSLKPKMIKIPSACNNHFEMLGWLCENYDGEIHVSTGMTTSEEVENIVKFFESKKREKDLVLYACTSGYPVPYEDVCLLEIRTLCEKYGNRVKKIGFSGHHINTATDVAAFVLGAEVIERHFTLCKQWKGTDHAASLEPSGLKQLVDDLNNTFKSLTFKNNSLLEIEKIQRKKLKYKKGYIVSKELTLKDAMHLINQNQQGFIFVEDADNRVVGILTDGDIRRALLNGASLCSKNNEWMNKDFVYVSEQYLPDELDKIFEDNKIKFVPVLNDSGHLVDIIIR